MRALSVTGKVGLEEHIKYIKNYRIIAQSIVQSEDIEDKSARRNNQKKSDGHIVSVNLLMLCLKVQDVLMIAEFWYS